jgi:hypothetical protein
VRRGEEGEKRGEKRGSGDNVQGHPQYRMKNTTQGLPSTGGNRSLTPVCALSPGIGTGWTGFCGGGGVVHDARALGAPHLTLAKGFAKPAPSFASPLFVLLPLEDEAKGSGILTPPSPALRSAICVVSLLNIALVVRGWVGRERGDVG